jgi:ribose/xylose/arabinose/galactoside ABC-type transport system permease subunit
MVAPLVVGLGASLALLGGVVDLSIGSAVGFAAMVFAVVLEAGASPWLAAAAALGAGLGVGVVNATVSVGFGADPIIATLGALVALRGLTLVLGDSRSKVAFVPGWQSALEHDVGPFSVPFLILVGAFALAAAYIARVRPGRRVTAAGGNVFAAARAGIRTGRIRIALFLLTGGCAALAGIVYAGQLGAAPVSLGGGLELQVFAAILLGGFSISRGGVGSPLGAALGIATLAMLSSLLNITGVVAFWQDVVTGCLLLVAVFLDRLRRGEGFR